MNIRTIEEYTRDRLYGRYVEVDGQTYTIEIRYELGGMNYFSSRTEPRGIFLGITPMKKTKEGGTVITSFTAWSGIKVLVQELSRYSSKVLEVKAKEYLNYLETDPHPDVVRILNAVIEKNKDKEVL